MWWVVLALTLGLMGLFHLLTGAGPLEARATLSLGFLLVAAHLGGELAKQLRSPRITGFVVTGFAVGPAWLGLVRADEVAALGIISSAAVALIAFAAGSALTLDALRSERAVIARVAAGAIAAPFLAVTVVVLTVSPWFPLTVHQPMGDAVAVALVLGTVAAASSPAVTMALITDLDARGPFSRSMITITVAQSVAVVVLLSLVLAVAQPLTSAGAVSPGIAVSAAVRLAGSVAVGAALGYVVASYLKLVERDTALFLVALGFFAAEVARVTGLDEMLVALAAGFYVGNFSPVESERLRAELKRGSLPVLVVFFALAGAGLRLDALRALWPWALLLIGLRIISLRAGLRWAARHPAVSPDLARHAWLGLISQAGMAIGLAAVARRAFPEWGVSLESLLVAMIGVHEVVGPICFRRALRLTGEVTEGEHVTEKAHAPGPALAPRSGGV